MAKEDKEDGRTDEDQRRWKELDPSLEDGGRTIFHITPRPVPSLDVLEDALQIVRVCTVDQVRQSVEKFRQRKFTEIRKNIPAEHHDHDLVRHMERIMFTDDAHCFELWFYALRDRFNSESEPCKKSPSTAAELRHPVLFRFKKTAVAMRAALRLLPNLTDWPEAQQGLAEVVETQFSFLRNGDDPHAPPSPGVYFIQPRAAKAAMDALIRYYNRFLIDQSDSNVSPPNLNGTEEKIYECLKKKRRRMTGEKIAEEIKKGYAGHVKGTLSAMVKAGVIDNKEDCRPSGYGLPEWS